jgi:hypothetical protein
MKSVKIVFKGGERVKKSNRRGEFYLSTLYAYMEISQRNTFVQLVYTTKSFFFK